MNLKDYTMNRVANYVNKGAEKFEIEGNIKILENKIKNTKLKLVRNAGAVVYSVAMNGILNFTLYKHVATIEECILCVSGIGISLVGLCLFYKKASNTLTDLYQLNEEKITEEKMLGKKQAEKEKAFIDYRIATLLGILSSTPIKTR